MRCPRRRSPMWVRKSTPRPSRASPTATLSGLPPTCSPMTSPPRSTMSISASPMTSARAVTLPPRRVLQLYRGGVDRYDRVKLTNPDKVLYPATGTTKARGLRLLRQRRRGDAARTSPAGQSPASAGPTASASRSFFEKQLASSAPDWLERGTIAHKSGTTTYPIIDTVEGLAWIAQQAALEVHVPQWRFVRRQGRASPGPATRIVFDLDPGEGVTMPQLCEVAHEVRDLIDDIGLHDLPAHQRQQGPASLCSAGRSRSARAAPSVLAKTGGPATGADDAQAGHRDDDQEPARPARCSWTGARTTATRPRSRRIRCAAANIRPSRRRAPGMRSTIRSCGTCGSTKCSTGWSRDGDLLAELDDVLPVADRLTTYRSMRDPGQDPGAGPRQGADRRATTTSSSSRNTTPADCTTTSGWNATVCWSVGRCRRTCRTRRRSTTSPCTPRTIRWSTSPSQGTSPRASTAAARSIVWDTGTYETEKFSDNAPDGPDKGGEVIVTLHGEKIDGRYALIQTDGKNWLAHRMKDQKRPTAADLAPMLSHRGVGPETHDGSVGVRGQVGRLPAAGRCRPRQARRCAPGAGATSPTSTRN